jgi:F1F0 ATPase subunit 2
MTDLLWLQLAIGLGAGMLAGAGFFGGLALTVRRLTTSRHPALLMVLSLLVRLAILALTLLVVAYWSSFPALATYVVGVVAARRAVVAKVEAGATWT